MKKVLMFIILSLGTIVTFAHDMCIDGIYYRFNNVTKEATVTFKGDFWHEYHNEYSGTITIPSSVSYNGCDFNVTSIADYAFYYCTGVKSVIMPNTITSIGNYAFQGCGIPSIFIPETVCNIGEDAFAYCTNLQSLVIDERNPQYVSEDNIIYTKDHTSLLYCVPSKEGSVVIPNFVTCICKHAFRDCKKIDSVSVPNSVVIIKENAFDGCTNISTISIPDSVTHIEEGAFHKCEKLCSLNIGTSVEYIGDFAFNGCYSLSSLTIPNSVKKIGEGAFANCRKLESVIIGKSVKKIGSTSFADCQNLKEVTCFAEDVPLANEYTFMNTLNHEFTLIVPDTLIQEYKSKKPWNKIATIRAL